jgi:hypothetical protein
MGTRIETLGGGRRAPQAAWFMSFAIFVVAAAFAVGTLIRSDGTTKAPASGRRGGVHRARAGETGPGFDQGGLQPRPFSPIPVDETVTVEKIPAGFVRMRGGGLRPKLGA